MEADISDGTNKNSYRDKSISISLSDKDKGKIKIDENIKVLFQFVVPHKECTVPKKIPPQFRNKMINHLDAKFMIPLIVSMFLHIVWIVSLQAMEYSSSVLTVDEILDRFKSVIIQSDSPPKTMTPPKELRKGEAVPRPKETHKGKALPIPKVKLLPLSKEEIKIAAKKSVQIKSKMTVILKSLYQDVSKEN